MGKVVKLSKHNFYLCLIFYWVAQFGPVNGAKHKQVIVAPLLIQTPLELHVVAALHEEMSHKVPEKPVAQVHVPSPVAGEFVVTQVPPFWHGFTEQNGTLVVQVGPLKFGKQLQLMALVTVLYVHAP